MNKLPTLTDKELEKWIKILGTSEIKALFIYNKIYLDSAQLDFLINYQEEKVEGVKNEKKQKMGRDKRKIF